MVQKYQNEISPIFYYGISRKTNEKDLKIPNLQLTDWKSPYWMTLYNYKITGILTFCERANKVDKKTTLLDEAKCNGL